MATQADFVELALGTTETTETNLGTITIPTQGIRRIVGVYGIATLQAQTTAEGVCGFFRLAFKSLAGVYRFPAQILAGPAGTLATGGSMWRLSIIPVDIPVPANETVTAYMALNIATASTCRGMVGLIME